MPGEFLSRIHNHIKCLGLGVLVCPRVYAVLCYFRLHFDISFSFFITGIRSVISLQTDKAVISPVKKSHNRSEIFWPGLEVITRSYLLILLAVPCDLWK